MPTDYIKINIRRGSTADWEKEDPVLALGEIAADTTKHLLKVGNGTSVWSMLPYYAIDIKVEDSLSSTSTTNALSANQGRLLDRKLQIDTATNWRRDNPVLEENEIALDTTSGRIKIGDGSTAWRNLSYVTPAVVDELSEDNSSTDALSAYQGWLLRNRILSKTQSEWEADNSVLDENVIGYDKTNKRIKVGDGNTRWKALPYVTAEGTGGGGTAGTIEIGTVTTGAAGSSASVTNVGTASAAKLNFTIPRGNPGPSGTSGYSTESWTFTLEDGTKVAKTVVLS